MPNKLKKLLAVFCAAAMTFCAVNTAAFAEDIIEQTAAVPEPVVVDEAYSETGFYIAEIDENAPAPDAGTSPLLHSTDQELVYSRMIAMKSSYPNGKAWDNSDTYVWNNIYYGYDMTTPYSKYTGGGCVAFCMIISDAAFGDAPAYEMKPVDYDALRVGDILRYNGNTHSVIILEKNDSGVTIAEGNITINGKAQIYWGRTLTKSEVESGDYYVTRYDKNDTPTPTPVGDEIDIDPTNFPDTNFRQYVSANFDTDNNDKLSKSEIAAAVDIGADSSSISSLKGIEFLTALENLRCSGNSLTSLDLSKNTALTHLECKSNQLTALDLSDNTALTELYCAHNSLTSLDLGKNTALTLVRCEDNNISALNVAKCTALTALNCGTNALASLDVKKNTKLRELYCGQNKLSAIDVSKNGALETLYCDDNMLTSIDVSGNPLLDQFTCSSNKLRRLDVSKNTALSMLVCGENMLTSLDLSANTALTSLYAADNKYSIGKVDTFDLTKLPGFDPAKASNWSGATFDGNKTITVTNPTITYKYDCGGGRSATFTLIAEDSANSVLTVGAEGDFDTIADAVAKINADIKAGAAEGFYTIKLLANHSEKKAVSLPDVPVTLMSAADAVLEVPSVTAKNDLTISGLTLITAKGKAAAVTAKKALTASDSYFGVTKVTGLAEISYCKINGALTLSAKTGTNLITNSECLGKITSSSALELSGCPETGAITSKGVLTVTGPTTIDGAVSITASEDVSLFNYVTVNGKITSSNEIEFNNCPKLGAITAKNGLVIMGSTDYCETGAITVSAKSGVALLYYVKVMGKLTSSCDLSLMECFVNGALSAKLGLGMSDCLVNGNVTASSKTELASLDRSYVLGNVSAGVLSMEDSTVSGKLAAKTLLSVMGEVIVLGDVSTGGIYSDADSSILSFGSLSITKDGILTDSKKLTLRLIKAIDKAMLTYEAVKMDPSDKKLNTVAKKFKGTFTEGIFELSGDNATGVTIALDKGKLIIK